MFLTMKLNQILQGIDYKVEGDFEDHKITDIQFESRKVEEGT